jgi:hypothetical protein
MIRGGCTIDSTVVMVTCKNFGRPFYINVVVGNVTLLFTTLANLTRKHQLETIRPDLVGRRSCMGWP